MRIFLYGLLALAPLPFASARPSWQWVWVVSVGLTALWYLFKNRYHTGKKIPKGVLLALWLGGLFVAWGYVQALPLFGEGLGVTNESADRLLSELVSISVDPQKTISNAVFYLSHGVFFWLVFSFCDRRTKALKLLRFCGLVVALYAVYGFVVFVSGNDTILWFQKWANQNSLTSTFVNRNSFAAFAGLGLQCFIAYAYFWIQDELIESRSGKELYRHVIETMVTNTWWLPLGIVLTAIALLLTNSRAGFGSVAIACFLLLLLLPNHYQRSRSIALWLAGYGMVMALAIGLFSLSGGVLETRLQAGAPFDQRLEAYSLVIEAIRDRPLTGFGLGTFDDVFRSYRDETITIYFDRAHNDYLELAMTAGIPATIMLMIAFFLLLNFLIRRLDLGLQYRSFIALGITTTVQLGLHSAVDFPLQIPAISYMWCAIMAASLAVANRCKKVSAGS